MKCVKTKGGEVKRIADDEAQELVRSGDATFVPKGEWKKDNPEHEKRAQQEAVRKDRVAAEKAKAAK